MAVQNKLQKTTTEKSVTFQCNGENVTLSFETVKNYLVSGNGAVTTQEVVMFINLCKFQHLNPFLREAYLIKYGTAPATMVVGKEVLTKRAMRNPKYAGMEAGIIVCDEKGVLENRIGSFHLSNEEIVGGWAKVYVKGYDKPVQSAVSFGEYCLMKNGAPASNWAAKPATMIRKVAVVQALREAFPEDLQDMYAAEEMNVDDSIISYAPVDVQQTQEVAQTPYRYDTATGEVLDDGAAADAFFAAESEGE